MNYEPEFCCDAMKESVLEMGAIVYIEKFDEYGLPVAEDGVSFMQLNFCPFCGRKLPDSKRDAWFARLEQLGFDVPGEQDIPPAYKSAQWWRNDAEVVE